jgi:cation diffusion facilitator family transporter
MRSTFLGILVNLCFSAAKISAGAVGHSFALVADGLESGADVLSGLVVFFGLKIAVKPPDRDHPYGHGKTEPIAALCVGLSLAAAAITIMVESIHEILTPHRLPAPYTLGVLIVKGFSVYTCRKRRRLDREPGGKERRGAPPQRRDHLSLCICRHLDSSIGRGRMGSSR